MENTDFVMDEDSRGEKWGKLRIGGLSSKTTGESLKKYFSSFGKVVYAIVEKYGKNSRGFGYVKFVESLSIEIVLKSGPHELDGRMIDPEPDIPHLRGKEIYWANRIYLAQLPPRVSEVDLRSVFEPYGKILGIDIIYDKNLKRNRRFGFISFVSAEPVERLLAEEAVNVDGKRVSIHPAISKNTRNSRRRNCETDKMMTIYKGPSEKIKERKDNTKLTWELVPQPLTGFEYLNEPPEAKSNFGCALHSVYLVIILFLLSPYFFNFNDQFFTPVWKNSKSENV